MVLFLLAQIRYNNASMKNFWDELPRPFFALAPMEAVTDIVFRQVVARAGRPDIFFTEFTNATGWDAAGDKAIGGRLVKAEDEAPIVAQLWGAVPEAMAHMSDHAASLGYDGIDINMGCPDSSAVKTGGGSGMIRTPALAGEMIAAAKTSGLPVSVKTRLGYSRVDEWQDWLAFLLQQDIAALTIHLRTKKEMSKVPAHFELLQPIRELRDAVAPHTPLIINGDIIDRAHGERLAEEHNVDGIMIGRGIFSNPFAFTGHTFTSPEDKKQQLLELLQLHLSLYDQWHEVTGRPYETLKRFYKIYVRDFEGSSDMRANLMQTKSTSEARALIATLQR